MKTPEEMAEEWAKQEVPQCHDRCCTPMDCYAYKKAERGFLAGYKAAQPRWISVNDRLPDKLNVWTMVYGCLISRWMVQPGFYDHEKKRWVSRFMGSEDEGYALLEAVTHWRELPTPPKDQK